jgi:hypothetical protein
MSTCVCAALPLCTAAAQSSVKQHCLA